MAKATVTTRETFQLQTRRTFFQNILQTLTLCCCYLILCESCTPSLTIVCFKTHYTPLVRVLATTGFTSAVAGYTRV